MKLAPLIATLAMLLLIFGVAISRPTTSDTKALPLDFTGIDTLRIIDAGDSPSIEFSDTAPAQASFPALKENTVNVARERSRMTIRTNMRGYSMLDVVVPLSVRSFEVESANFESGAPLEQVRVRAAIALRWEGDIRYLRIDATPPHRTCKKDCSLGVEVAGGRIGKLELRAPDGSVNFVHPDKVVAADLYLGPKGSVTLFNATRLGHIVLHDSTEP